MKRKMIYFALAAGAVTVLLLVVPAVAHHVAGAEAEAAAGTDDAPSRLAGTILSLRWLDPHSWFGSGRTAAEGSEETEMVEGGTPDVSQQGALARVEESIEIPLRVDRGRLLVPVQATDGSEFQFVLTLANPTLLSESTAARLGDHSTLTLGGVPLEMEGSVTVPDAELTSDGMVLAGMVGPTTLNQFDVLVDVPGRRLVLKPIGALVEWEGMTMSDPIRVLVLHGILMGMDVEFNGKEFPAMLDLGMGTLVVNEPVREQTKIDAEDEGTLQLGGTTFFDLPVRTLDLPLFGGWDPDGKGFVVVGAPVAYDCALSLSWVHREIRTCVR